MSSMPTTGAARDRQRHVERGLADLVAADDADVEVDAVAGGVGEQGGAGADREPCARGGAPRPACTTTCSRLLSSSAKCGSVDGHELDARDELIGHVEREAEGGGTASRAAAGSARPSEVPRGVVTLASRPSMREAHDRVRRSRSRLDVVGERDAGGVVVRAGVAAARRR